MITYTEILLFLMIGLFLGFMIGFAAGLSLATTDNAKFCMDRSNYELCMERLND